MWEVMGPLALEDRVAVQLAEGDRTVGRPL